MFNNKRDNSQSVQCLQANRKKKLCIFPSFVLPRVFDEISNIGFRWLFDGFVFYFFFYFVHVICKLFCISRFNDPNLSSALTKIFSYLFKSFFFLEKVELFVKLIEPLRKNRLWNARFNAIIAHIMEFTSHRTKFLPR